MLNFASANHSPNHFENPDEFDITRAGANKHISFGKGIHFRFGAGLSRMEARIALELLAERLPTLRLSEGQTFDYFPNITFRGPNSAPWSGQRRCAVQKFLYELNRTRRYKPPTKKTVTQCSNHMTSPKTKHLRSLSPILASCFTLVSMDRSLCTLCVSPDRMADYLQRMRDGIANYGPVREGVYARTTSLADVVAPVHQSTEGVPS